jgi:hypothetical protein
VQGSPVALNLRAMNMLYESIVKRGSLKGRGPRYPVGLFTPSRTKAPCRQPAALVLPTC